VDLGAGLGRDVSDAYVVATSPESSTKTCSSRAPGQRGRGRRAGDVRAYDVRNRPHSMDLPHDSPGRGIWLQTLGQRTPGERPAVRTAGPAMTVDVQRGVVYVPLGSASPDFYGGGRSAPICSRTRCSAARCRDGQRRWHFQKVHHDLWGSRSPRSANLVNVTRDGRRVQPSHRSRERLRLCVRSRLGPTALSRGRASHAAVRPQGEQAWPTQPIPLQPHRSRARRSPRLISNEAALARFRTLRHGALFTPPVTKQHRVPGFDGGGEWAGRSRSETGVLYVMERCAVDAAMRDTAAAPRPVPQCTPTAARAATG